MEREEIRELIRDAGAVAVGFAKAEDVDVREMERYRQWIADGKHAGMDYLARHAQLKTNPAYVLENASTVISVAFSYAPPLFRDSSLPMIACYAYGSDYHDVIRQRLMPVVAQLKKNLGGEWRICIDSAPIAERYWALKSGIGIRGCNSTVIVEGAGAYAFLAEIVTTIDIQPDEPSTGECKKCGACLSACPQNALSKDGLIDSRRCLNYLTIEHRGDWEGEYAANIATTAGSHTLYGCDRCLRICPHNRGIPPTTIEEFMPRDAVILLTADDVESMTQEQFSATFKGSPIKRAKLTGLQRNARNVAKISHIDSTDNTDNPNITSTDSSECRGSL